MALIKLIDAATAAVLEPAATVFSPAGSFVIDAVGLKVNEFIVLYKLMSDGLYHPATNKEGSIVLSANPNNVLIDVPGSYKLVKPASTAAVTAGWELV